MTEAPLGALPDLSLSAARRWLQAVSEREGVWRDVGVLSLPSAHLFVGDPTNGHDGHMECTAPVDAQALHLWVFGSGPDPSPYLSNVNALIWLEADGSTPVARGRSLDFGVDAACLAVGDLDTGQAFTRLSDLEYEAGREDNFAWLLPYIQASPHFATWVEVPPDDHPMFIASTANDGGFAAVWLHDAEDRLAGILIDISGRVSDGLFLDRLLPERALLKR